MVDEPTIFRCPTTFRECQDLLGYAKNLNLTNAVLVSQLDNGNVVFLTCDLTGAEANWLLDKAKSIVLTDFT